MLRNYVKQLGRGSAATACACASFLAAEHESSDTRAHCTADVDFNPCRSSRAQTDRSAVSIDKVIG